MEKGAYIPWSSFITNIYGKLVGICSRNKNLEIVKLICQTNNLRVIIRCFPNIILLQIYTSKSDTSLPTPGPKKIEKIKYHSLPHCKHHQERQVPDIIIILNPRSRRNIQLNLSILSKHTTKYQILCVKRHIDFVESFASV